MKFKPVLLAVLLASAGLSAFSQSPMGYDRMDQRGQANPARMQAHMDKKNAALKAQLKLTAAQEGSWVAYTAAIKPPANMPMPMSMPMQHDELAKLPTPERIDKMKALHSQRMAEMTAAMDQRGEATKTFYATLTLEQKSVFDSATLPQRGDMGHKGPKGHAGPGKP